MAIPPINADLVIEQGTSWGVRWLISDPITCEPLNISLWSARAQVRNPIESAVVLHEWSSALGTITLGVDGWLTLLVAPATSSAWTWVNGRYDVELTNLSLQVARISQGRVQVSHEVTR